jgi:S-formylglutathione hydrolase FrmB
MPQRHQMNRYVVFLILSCFAISLGLPGLIWSQFNEPNDRRRADLGPIALPGGSIVEFSSFDSKSLGMQERYSVFLPPSYSKNPARKYPVVYFLHGLNNDETSWTVERYGHIQNILEEMILSGKLPEFIMVHPRGDNSFYCNYIDGTRRYEDMVTQELIAYMETRYRAASGRENRAMAGTSMGGYGALKIAMKYPDRYAAVSGQSPILFPGTNPLELTDDAKSSRFYSFFTAMLKPIFGDPLRQDLWDANNPLILATKQKLDGLKVYFDYGTDDRYIPLTHLDEGSRALDKKLTEAHIPHIFKAHPGEPHGWALIAAHLSETLPFLCQSFAK